MLQGHFTKIIKQITVSIVREYATIHYLDTLPNSSIMDIGVDF